MSTSSMNLSDAALESGRARQRHSIVGSGAFQDGLAFIATTVVTFGIIVSRNLDPLLNPILYTEDAVWFSHALSFGYGELLLNARRDYFIHANILVLALGHGINFVLRGYDLSIFPQILALASYGFVAVVCAAPLVLLRHRISLSARILLALLAALSPLGDSSNEVLGRVSNLGLFVSPLCLWLLVYRHDMREESRLVAYFTIDALLFLCAMTNPVAMVMVLVFFSAAAAGHVRQLMSEGKLGVQRILSTPRSFSGATLAGLIVLFGSWMAVRIAVYGQGGAGTDEYIPPTLSQTVEIIVGRMLLYPLLFPVYLKLTHPKALAAALGLLVVLVFLVLDRRRKAEFAAATFATFAVVAASIVATRSVGDWASGYRGTFPDRYFVGPSLIALTGVVAALSQSWTRKGLAGGLAKALTVTLIAVYLVSLPFLVEQDRPRLVLASGSSFLKTLMDDCGDRDGRPRGTAEECRVRIHPRSWHPISIPRPYVEATLAAAARRAPP